MMKCDYCGASYSTTHTCWGKYCVEVLGRDCDDCSNVCKYTRVSKSEMRVTEAVAEIQEDLPVGEIVVEEVDD